MVRLVDFMGEGPALQFWRGQALPIERAWQGQGLSGPPPLATSWRSAVIAEMEGEIAGLAVIAPLVEQDATARRLPGLVRPLQELENLVPGSLCIHVLSVYPAYRHRSVARTLLGHVLGKSGGRDVSAICAAGNFPAIALLAGSGFQPRAVRPSEAGDYMLYLRALGAG